MSQRHASRIHVRVVIVTFALTAAFLAAAGIARAQSDPLKCERAVLKNTTKFLGAKVKALQKCEEAKAKGQHGDNCSPPSGAPGSPGDKALQAVLKASSKLQAAIEKACGGLDKACGTGDDNLNMQSLGFPATCENFENGACTNAIGHCGDLADCIECIGMAATDQLIDFLYDSLESAHFGSTTSPGKEINKCQITLGKEVAKFAIAKNKIIGKCWDARYKAKHSADCPNLNANPVTAKDAFNAALKIAKAESKKIAQVCKACGGADQACDDPVDTVNPGTPSLGGSGGGDDLALGDIFGTVPSCPAVTVPAGADHGAVSCARPLLTLADLAFCVDCLAEFKVDCLTPASVIDLFGGAAVVASECNPGGGGSCPTTLELEGQNNALRDLDFGPTAIDHDRQGAYFGRMTLAVSGCSGSGNPDCDVCSLSGPLPNIDTFQRCGCDPSVTCTASSQCPGSCPCRFFLGPPLPLSDIGFCLTTELAAPVTGTVDVEAGAVAVDVALQHTMYVTGNTSSPCPTCTSGSCVGGPESGMPCTVQGTGVFPMETVSLDCPPGVPASSHGIFTSQGTLATGTQTRTLGLTSPPCTASGWSTRRCLCDTCQTAAAEPCATDADCPAVRTCGGLRCLGGGNDGDPCTVLGFPPECGGAPCGTVGEPTKNHSCAVPGICTPNTPPDLDSVDEGVCATGPSNGRCTLNPYKGCLSDAACMPSFGTCVFALRNCFTADGLLGESVTAAGVADPPVAGSFDPVLSGLFCMQSGNAIPFVTVPIGLPGLNRPTIPVAATIN